MKYEDQLKTSTWLRMKYQVMKRDNFVCSNCLCDNYEKQLEVHHITYVKHAKAWDYPEWMLVTLCRDCHQKEHDNRNTEKITEIIKWIKKFF